MEALIISLVFCLKQTRFAVLLLSLPMTCLLTFPKLLEWLHEVPNQSLASTVASDASLATRRRHSPLAVLGYQRLSPASSSILASNLFRRSILIKTPLLSNSWMPPNRPDWSSVSCAEWKAQVAMPTHPSFLAPLRLYCSWPTRPIPSNRPLPYRLLQIFAQPFLLSSSDSALTLAADGWLHDLVSHRLLPLPLYQAPHEPTNGRPHQPRRSCSIVCSPTNSPSAPWWMY